jgi:hypothetical protein
MTPPQPSSLLVFRPPLPLRLVLLSFALLSGVSAALLLVRMIGHGDAGRLPGFFVLLLPCALAAAAWRQRIEVREEGLRSTTLLRRREIPWRQVRRIDQTRRSFVFVTEQGNLSASWIAPADRDLLFRKVLERAKLTFKAGENRWGIKAQYVPREQPVQFIKPPKREA